MQDDTSSRAAKEVLATLAYLHQMLRDRAIELRGAPGVEEVLTGLEPVSSESTPIVASSLEVSLSDGKWLCWFLNVRWNATSWTINTSFVKKSGEDSVTMDLPTRKAHEFLDFTVGLKKCMRELLDVNPPEVWPSLLKD